VPSRVLSDSERTAVLEEMNHIISHPTFKSSKLCVAMFRYLVAYVLSGSDEGLKERTLGIAVFGLGADYDTSTETVVRKTASDIRKRLALYYSETKSDPAVRIQLDRGGYLPEFSFAAEDRTPERIEDEIEKPISTEENHPEIALNILAPQVESRRGRWLVWVGAALIVAAGCLYLFRNDPFRTPEYKIWKPLIEAGDPINLCLPVSQASAGGSSDSQATNAATSLNPNPNQHSQNGAQYSSRDGGLYTETPFNDAGVAQEISTQLSTFKRHTQLKSSSSLTFQDLHMQPTVVIGGLNNPWTSNLLSSLRYKLQVDPETNDPWIQDGQNPSMRDWKVDNKLEAAGTFDDYALITRFFDKETGQWVMALSGLTGHGTEAAGAFVADPTFANLIAGKVLAQGNFQIVLRISVLHGNSGPFQTLTVYTW